MEFCNRELYVFVKFSPPKTYSKAQQHHSSSKRMAASQPSRSERANELTNKRSHIYKRLHKNISRTKVIPSMSKNISRTKVIPLYVRTATPRTSHPTRKHKRRITLMFKDIPTVPIFLLFIFFLSSGGWGKMKL